MHDEHTPAMTNKLLTRDLFGDRIGQTWVIDEPNAPAIALTLTEVESLRNYAKSAREPFSLAFVTHGDFVLPQRMYALRHAALGPMSIFLVPIAKSGDTTTYQAVFN
jgi:hypothetical protein